jgi:hypothetical protein
MGGCVARPPVAMTARLKRSFAPPDLHRVRPGEMGLSQEHIHAQLCKALGRIMRTDIGAELAHPLHNGREVHLRRLRHPHAEMAGIPYIESSAGGSNDGLGGNATHS